MKFFNIILLLISVNAYSQQGNVWAFGLHGGLDFNSGEPDTFTSAVTYTNGSLIPWFASSMSDCNGKLLFYSEGRRIWNKNHQLMPHGDLFSFLPPNFWYNSNSQNNMTIKIPNETNKYYLISGINKCGCTPERVGMYYSVIDMSLDGGLGDIDTTNRVVQFSSTLINFKLGIASHANKMDKWVVTHNGLNNCLESYLMTQSGISSAISWTSLTSLGFGGGLGCGNNSINYLKFSHDEKTLILSLCSGLSQRVIELKFDKSTGLFSSPKVLVTTASINFAGIGFYGLETSSNDSLLYFIVNAPNIPTSSWQTRVYQLNRFDTLPESTIVELNAFISVSNTGIKAYGLQIGPNQKIYIFYADSIGSIENPNKQGFACNFKKRWLGLNSNLPSAFSPNLYFPIHKLYFKSNAGFKTDCQQDSVQFQCVADSGLTEIKYYFYNASGILIDSSSRLNPGYFYSNNGIYPIKLKAKNGNCDSYTWYSDSVYVNHAAKLSCSKDSSYISCSRQFLRIKYQTYNADSIRVNWNDGSVTSWIKADTIGYFTHNYFDTSHIYSVLLSAKNQTCNSSIFIFDTVKLQARPTAKLLANNATKTFPINGCTPVSINITDSSKNAGSVWTIIRNGSGINYQLAGSNYQLTDTGWFDIVQYATTKDGCIDSFVVTNAVYVSPKVSQQISLDSTYKKCIQNNIRLKTIASYGNSTTINWGDGNSDALSGFIGGIKTDTISHFYSGTGSFKIRITSANSYCAATDSILHFVRAPIQIVTSNDTSICKGVFANLRIKAFGADSVFSYLLQTPGSILTSSNGSFFLVPDSTTTFYIGAVNTCAKDTVWKKIIVTLKPPLKIQLNTKDTLVCKGSSFTLKASGNGGDDTAKYRFSFYHKAAFFLQNHSGVFNFIADSAATYYVVLSDGCSPNDTISFTITIHKPLTLVLNTKDSILCQPGNILLQAKGIGGDSVNYSFSLYKSGAFQQSNHSGTFTFFHDSTASYNVIVSDACSKNDTITFNYSIRAPINLKLNTIDTTICKNAALTIKVTTIGGSTNFIFSLLNAASQLISTNSTGSFVIPTDSNRTYIFTVADNCSGKNDSIMLKVKIMGTDNKDTVTVLYTTVLDSVTTYTVWKKLPDKVSYSIRGNIVVDTFFIHNNSKPSLQSENYYVSATDICGNKTSLSQVAQTIFLQAENQNFNTFALLHYTPYETWQQGVLRYEIEYKNAATNSWIKLDTAAGNKLSAQASMLPDSINSNTSVSQICYRIKAIEQNGNQQRSISNVACVPIYPVVFIPNAFSPNGDGLNDYFKPVAAGLNAYIFEIYDRWGTLVYSDTPESKGWDGTFRGEALPVGTYVFRLSAAGNLVSKFTNAARRVEQKGILFLVR